MNRVNSSRFLDPGAAPAISCDLLASKQWAWARCLFRLAGVQLTVAAQLVFGMFWVLLGIYLGRISGVAQASSGGVCFTDHRCGGLSHGAGGCQNRCASGNLHKKYAACGVVHRGLVFGFKRLNSPNDIVVKSDGSVWFTDPSFGILGFYEGQKAQPELPTNVYRIDADGSISLAAEGINFPNGLAFSPDESILYIVESRGTPRHILGYDVVNGRQLTNRRIVIDAGPGTPDGFRLDVDGNLWCGWGMGAAGLDGVHVFNPAGKLIGRIDLPERCANLCFGGVHRNRLFMAASTSLYALYVNVQGVGYS